MLFTGFLPRSLLLAMLLTAFGCATPFPRPDPGAVPDPDAQTLFLKSFQAHGGARRNELGTVSVALDGDWKFLITRIQPLVTDHRYRVRSEERLQPATGLYAASYEGPAGRKVVYRTPPETRVYYDNQASTDPDVLASTALTADSSTMFVFSWHTARIAWLQ